MKKIIKQWMLTLMIVIITKLNYAQVSVPANNGGPANYVGWNSGQLQDLTIKHENNRFINFYTNAGLGGLANPRMRILAGLLTGNGTTTDGFIGIGDFDFFTPSNLLHQHLNFNRSNYHQFTNLNTGNAATDGFRIGLTYTAPVTNAEINIMEAANLNFLTNNTQRITIVGLTGANQGFVGINTPTPTYTLTVNGTVAANRIIIVTANKEQDLMALIIELQSEVAELKDKLLVRKN